MDMHTRLKEARKAAGFEKAMDAIRAHGWNKNTYSSNENGNRAFGRQAAEKYADAFGVSLEWLLTGRGDMKPVASTAKIVDIWSKIPERDRATAFKMLEGLAKDQG